MPTLKRKVFAYITHGDRLLVFSHPFAPAAGIQVPAGTVEAGEALEDAVMREAFEETGLRDLALVRFLGEATLDFAPYGRDEIHHRFFYHLRCAGDPPATWRHSETDPSDGGGKVHVFEFFWARLPDEIPELFGEHGRFLPALLESNIAP